MLASRYQDWASFTFPAALPAAGAPAAGAPAAGAPGAPVAFCADLSPASVLGAYRRGIIPMPAPDEYFRTLNEFRYEDQVRAGTIAVVGDEADDPYWVAWWSPDPRPVIDVARVHLGRNVRKRLRGDALSTSADVAFGMVARACRADREPRWLTDTLLDALTELHRQGWAHSIEVWRDEELVGGAMGIGIGGIVSGDSLFARHPGAAAIAVADLAARLAEAGGTIIDAQWESPFLRSLGAMPMERARYLDVLGRPAGPTPLPTGRRPAQRLLPARSARGLSSRRWARRAGVAGGPVRPADGPLYRQAHIGLLPPARPARRSGQEEQTLDFLQGAYAHIMGRTAYEGMAANLPANPDNPWADILNAARKVVFSRTLETASGTVVARHERHSGCPATAYRKIREYGHRHPGGC
jgi:leucyl/phenylalanyl-tRNA--protein transferase